MSRSRKDGRCGGGHKVYNHGIAGTGWDYWCSPVAKRIQKRKASRARRQDDTRMIRNHLRQADIDFHDEMADLATLEAEINHWFDNDEPVDDWWIEPELYEYDDPEDYYDFDYESVNHGYC